MRHLKVLGLVLVAVLAISATGASAASAQVKSSSYPSTLTGSQVGSHVFTIDGGFTVVCPVAFFGGVLKEEASTVGGVTAEYKGNGENQCEAFGLSATVSMNGCTYTFHDTNVVTVGVEHTGTVDLVCPAGKAVTLIYGTCEVQIGSQTGLGPVVYRDDGTTNHLTLNPNVSKAITYNKTKDGFLCPLNGTGEKADGSYAGTTTVSGEDPETEAADTLSLS